MARSVEALKARYKRKIEDAATPQERFNLEAELEGLLQEQAGIDSAPPKGRGFKPCASCPTPGECSAAGKCKKQGYAKGGMVTKAKCGASVPPNRMSRK